MQQAYETQTETESHRLLATLADAIEKSIPPETALAYRTCWRCWWRVALAIMRPMRLSTSERDAIHRDLLAKYQGAAIRMAQEEAA